MLDACAGGWSDRKGPHKWCIMWQGRTYPSLPLGEHGKVNPGIEVGHIRQMIRALRIDMECAKRHLQILR